MRNGGVKWLQQRSVYITVHNRDYNFISVIENANSTQKPNENLDSNTHEISSQKPNSLIENASNTICLITFFSGNLQDSVLCEMG